MKDKSLIRGHYDVGRYIISGDEPCAENLRNWITGRGFKQYEQQTLRFDQHGRPHSKLYNFYLPETGCEVIMKTCHASSEYRWPRQFELIVKQYIKDYNKTAFLGCRRMHLAGMPVARPLAFWNVRRGLLDQTSYFLYQKIEANCSLSELCKAIRQTNCNDAADLLKIVKKKAISIIQTMHNAGLRHNDSHGQNFLINIPMTARLSSADIEQSTYRLIDYDHYTRAIIPLPILKRFFDIRELRRTWIDDSGPHQLLDIYLNGQQSPFAHAALEFWCRGGFNPLRWLFSQHKKKYKRYLKKKNAD